jgi:outer membrane protein
MKMTNALVALGVALGMVGATAPALAGDPNGDFMVRVLGTVVDPDSQATVKAGGVRIPDADADVSTQFIPAATLTYFFNPAISAELFCCFSKHDIKGTRSISALGEIADTWIFPPALTLQYHFNSTGAFRPYLGVGGQYINFFDTGTGDNVLGAQKVSIDDAVGFTIQAGLDFSMGNGWFLNADVKKTWLDTTVTWHKSKTLGGINVVADADIDPVIVSVGLGYRFNLFGPRIPEPAPIALK